MSRNFWPFFVSVATVSAALGWRVAPDVGQKLPYPFRDLLHDVVCGRAQAPTAAVDGPSAAAAPAVAADKAGKDSPAGADQASAVDSARAAKGPAPVPKTAQNPTGSPYLESAAQALREYRRMSEEFEKRQKSMGMAEQRAEMKKLHAQNQRVEYFNRKHREWKASHPAAPASR